MRLILIFIIAVFVSSSCKKNAENGNCVLLKEGISANNKQQVNNAITNYINSLPITDYTEANVNKLVQTITGGCNIKGGLYCFDCISTLPSQTEIWLEITASGGIIRKVIDLTYTQGTTKMKFSNMHD
jgi:hypothetical protein